MVIFDLICQCGHYFEGWFTNSDDLEKQKADGLLSCPFCGSKEVNKKITAPKLSRKSNSLDTNIAPNSSRNPASTIPVSGTQSPKEYAKLQKMLTEVHNYIEHNFEDVGNRFADEALQIHRGEKDATNIRGIASKQELKELADEGVSALPLPPKPVDKSKLN